MFAFKKSNHYLRIMETTYDVILTYIGITVILVNIGIISTILLIDHPLIKRIKQFQYMIKHWFTEMI